MKLSKRTTRVLSNFSEIHSGIHIKRGNRIETMSMARNVWAKALVDEEFPEDFAIYELSRFLGVLALFDEPEIDVSKEVLVISESKEGSPKNKVHYRCADPSLLKSKPPEKDLPILDYDTSFSLPSDTLKAALKASSTLSVDDIILIGENGKVRMKVADVNEPTSHVYSVELGDTNVSFELQYKKDTLNVLPADYKVEVCSEMNVARFSADDGNIEYLLAAEQD